MLRHLTRLAASSGAVLLSLTMVTFLLARVLPSDPALAYIGPKATPAQAARLRADLGLDEPLPVQYWKYLTSLVRGDWGNSLATKRPVLDEIASRLPSTLELIFAAMLVAAVVGTVLGVIAARRPGGRIDGLVRLLSIGGVSVPAFWLGLLLQMLFVDRLQLLPATGAFSNTLKFTDPVSAVTGLPLLDSLLTGNWTALGDGLSHLVLPAATLAAYPLGLVARMIRGSMIEVFAQDHVTAARAYGLRESTVVWSLALRNAASPTLTVLGMATAYSITGTFFVEIVFNWPGIGQFATEAMLAVDYPAIMAITLLGAVGYLGTNAAVDLLQAKIDPRVRPS
ncbi:ABC transporter permease [Streptomyces sp. GC420]|uniref:ABC transporter permease n=1 Tax=Streptomyces sp. GC420 TaxID=2697568 RepID=UPI0014151607|nr:ABC transporter permease [Streptomyces sp. GC420]NBM16626.1 ABC transporter permease subunit [Streptomyces sp. GC420]